MRSEGTGASKISKEPAGNRTRNLLFCDAIPPLTAQCPLWSKAKLLFHSLTPHSKVIYK